MSRNRSFLRKTPSISDLEVQTLIKKYPIKAPEDHEGANNMNKLKTNNIIDQINEELESKKTKRYANYVNMGMIAEKFNIE